MYDTFVKKAGRFVFCGKIEKISTEYSMLLIHIKVCIILYTMALLFSVGCYRLLADKKVLAFSVSYFTLSLLNKILVVEHSNTAL